MTEIDELCKKLVQDPSLAPEFGPDGSVSKTHCNHFVQRVLGQLFNFHKFDSLMANAIIQHLELDDDWGKVDGEKATQLSENLKLVIASQKNKAGHGHVAIVSSEPMQMSGSWSKNVPMIWNVGKKNGLFKCSECFRTEPDYFGFKL